MARKKKKQKNKNIPVVAPEQDKISESLIKEYEKSDEKDIFSRITDPLTACGFIEKLPLNQGFPTSLVLAIRDKFKDKRIDKAVKRIFFKLENMGLGSLVKDEKKTPSIIRPIEREKPEAYIGNVDNLLGSRPVFFALYDVPFGVEMGMGYLSDESGFLEFICGNVSKKKAKKAREQMEEKIGPLVETTLPHVLTILEETLEVQKKLGLKGEALDAYMEIRPMLFKAANPLKEPVIYSYMSPSGKVSSKELEQLFDHEPLRSWLINPYDIEPFVEEIRSIDESPIVLANFQKKERRRNIIQKCVEKIFPRDKVYLMKRRLEEIAYIHFKRGEEDMAQIAVNTASELWKDNSILMINHVLEFIVEKSISSYLDQNDQTVDENYDLLL